MRGRDTAERAVHSYVAELALVVECVTNRRLVVRRDSLTVAPAYSISFPMAVSLRAIDGGASGFLLRLRHTITVAPSFEGIRGDWQIDTRTYDYRLLDRNERELLVYHWQPGPDYEGPDHPHIHVSAFLDAQVDALSRRQIDLDKLHIVTGPVALQAVIRMLITEFQIRPLRADWQERLGATSGH